MKAAMKKMIATAKQLSVADLQAECRQWANDTSDVADLMYAAVLGALEEKMPEAEFIAFCETV